MAVLGWSVLLLVFVDEVLAAIAVGVGGQHLLGTTGAVLGPVAVVAAWWTWASPKAPYGGPVRRPLVKALVLGAATAGLWVAGHQAWALAFLAFSVIVNGLAQIRSVRALVADHA